MTSPPYDRKLDHLAYWIIRCWDVGTCDADTTARHQCENSTFTVGELNIKIITCYVLIQRSRRDETFHRWWCFSSVCFRTNICIYPHISLLISCFYDIRQSAAAKVPLAERTVWRHLGSACHEVECKLWQWCAERSRSRWRKMSGWRGEEAEETRWCSKWSSVWVAVPQNTGWFLRQSVELGIQTLNHKIIYDSARLLMEVPQRLLEFETWIQTSATIAWGLKQLFMKEEAEVVLMRVRNHSSIEIINMFVLVHDWLQFFTSVNLEKQPMGEIFIWSELALQCQATTFSGTLLERICIWNYRKQCVQTRTYGDPRCDSFVILSCQMWRSVGQ